jgi:hypothetical protein
MKKHEKNPMHIFTSLTSNYIPKARVLGHSLKKYHPEAAFHLLLSDLKPDWLEESGEPFDSIIHVEELPIKNVKSWIFKHTLIELCTAVKGFGFQEIFRRYNPQNVIYLDPDIVVTSRMDSIIARLDKASVLLTPHQTEPDTEIRAIIDNEICSLKHGVYNLGFLAVRNSDVGRRFVDWWANRLDQFCFDDIPSGLFTDQRWVDLAPGFFDDLMVMRDPIYNVCTWNLSHRTVTGKVPDGLFVNGQPLCFYHFSGFDSGAQKVMLDIYGKQSPVLRELRDWYIEECRKMGQDEHGNTPCVYDNFSNGQKVTKSQRYIYRISPDLIKAFPDPYDAAGSDTFFEWSKMNVGTKEVIPDSGNYEDLLNSYKAILSDLNAIRNSKSWRILKWLGIVKR